MSATSRTILITGGSSGIGRAISDALICTGWEVFIISRRHPSEWENGAPSDWDITRNWICANLSDASQVSRIMKDWTDKLGDRVDVLIQSAALYAGQSRHTFLDTSLTEWNTLFGVNVRAQYQITKAVLPFLLKKPRAAMLFISSEAAFKAQVGRIAYASSKAASHMLFKGLAEELHNTNVSAIELLPKMVVDTPGVRKRRPKSFDFSNYMSPSIFATPVCGLVKSLGNGLNGATLVVDEMGGCTEIVFSDPLANEL